MPPMNDGLGREGTETMQYRMDPTLLPDGVRDALENLHSQILLHTDYQDVQITYEDMHKEYKPIVDVVVSKFSGIGVMTFICLVLYEMTKVVA